MKEATQPVDRETLYNEVWTDPVTVVAPRYGLSDVGLAKICRTLAIPLPSRGYWAKVKAGRIMNRVPLPDLKQEHLSRTGLVKLPPEQAEIREATRKASARLRKELHVEPLPEQSSSSLHPLVRSASERLRRRDGWPENTLLRSAPKDVLNISVTKASLDRTLGIVDGLIKSLATQGFEFEVNPDQGETLIRWLETGTTMAFSLAEQVKRLPHVITPAEERAQKRYWGRSRWDGSVEYPNIARYDFIPTGVLTIEVGRWPSRSSWKDTPRTRLEQRLSGVIAGVLDLARQTHAKQLEETRRKEAHQRAVAHYEFLTRRLTDEVERFKQLESQATNWERAARLRDYANAVERQTAATGGPSAEQVDWLSWARAKADWLDPLVQVSDPIIDAPEPKRPGFGWG
ncbi:hypothetical protein [Cupriavidus neocaledonicus]|nr:hypothetical protein [Cupriavidus neocaledonicus]